MKSFRKRNFNLNVIMFPFLLSPPVVIVGVYSAPESLGNPESELHPLRVTGLAH